jgi:hypothetical protein
MQFAFSSVATTLAMSKCSPKYCPKGRTLIEGFMLYVLCHGVWRDSGTIVAVWLGKSGRGYLRNQERSIPVDPESGTSIASVSPMESVTATRQYGSPETAKVIQQQRGRTSLGHLVRTGPNRPNYIGRCSRHVEAHLLSSQGSSSFSDACPKITVPVVMRSRCLSLSVNSDISKSEAGADPNPSCNIRWCTSCGVVEEEDHPFDEVDTNKCAPKQPPPV